MKKQQQQQQTSVATTSEELQNQLNFKFKINTTTIIATLQQLQQLQQPE